jgi:hypothetical protein
MLILCSSAASASCPFPANIFKLPASVSSQEISTASYTFEYTKAALGFRHGSYKEDALEDRGEAVTIFR